MKKVLLISLVIILMVGMITLTGCTKKDNSLDTVSGTSKGEGFDLKLDFKHMNDKEYSVKLAKNSGDTIDEYDEEEPNFVRYYNEKENYVLDLTLDAEAKESYDIFQKTAKDESDFYKEVKFGKYEGYYADDNGEIYGYILLDKSDDTFNVFVSFNLYLDDEENGDVKTTFESTNIKNILNNIEFNVSK